MANYSNLLATIAANIYQNNNNEVTADMVKTAMDAVVACIGNGYLYKGVATPATDPSSPDEKVFYLASEAGTYTNFGGLVVAAGEVAILKGSGNSWSKDALGVASTEAITAINATIATIINAITKYTYTQLVPVLDESGKFIHTDGSVRINANTGYMKFAVSGSSQYAFSGRFGSGYNVYYLYAFDSGDNFIGRIGTFRANDGVNYDHQLFTTPASAAYVTLNYQIARKQYSAMYSVVSSIVRSEDLDERISAIEASTSLAKKMRVVVTSVAPSSGETFRVRAKYNDEKDILMVFYVNGNGILNPNAAYIGANTLTDAQLADAAFLVNNCSDSIAPIFESSVYWHLFANHGYCVPTIDNSVGMTAADVGAKWKDQLDREYFVGKVTASTITLLPVIYQDPDGNDTRGWKTPSSASIGDMTHISGGDYTSAFTASGQSYAQIRPIMRSIGRKLYADGVEITAPGTYDCDEFKANEMQVGFDPASITDFFPTDLDTASVMAIFTWSYNFYGPTYCVNTTIDLRKKIEFRSYGANQQQFFFDETDGDDTYKAMFLIPKAKERGGVEYDKPFNIPDSSQPTIGFFRTSAYLKDVDDPIDRMIGYLYDDVNDRYRVGLAVGLSLVSGDTITAKRIQYLPVGDDNAHYRLGTISPANRNKFYIAAFNTAPYEADGYMAPDTLFKEINYYVSYFDPAQNVGQVYWYKDGSKFVIYAHCQSAQDRLAVNLPQEMEGLALSVVEKTAGATLLSSTIQNGKLFVSYTNDANYIVMTAE